MDDADHAAERQQLMIDKGIEAALRLSDSKHELGVCAYCGDLVKNESFCFPEDGWSCASQYQLEKDSELRNIKI